MFRLPINGALTILNIGKIGSGKSYVTAIILRNIVSRIKNKGQTSVTVFNPSGDKTYEILKETYESNVVSFDIIKSVEELADIITQAREEVKKEGDIDADFVDKQSKRFIIRRVFIFDDVGGKLKGKNAEAFKDLLLACRHLRAALIMNVQNFKMIPKDCRQNITQLIIHDVADEALEETLDAYFSRKQRAKITEIYNKNIKGEKHKFIYISLSNWGDKSYPFLRIGFDQPTQLDE